MLLSHGLLQQKFEVRFSIAQQLLDVIKLVCALLGDALLKALALVQKHFQVLIFGQVTV